MIKNLLIAIISIIGIGCQKFEPIEIQSVIGEFYSIENSEDYSHLELREDRTFHFDQAKNHSCNIWGHFYGDWEIEKGKILLFEGIDLDSIIEVKSSENLKSDTLKIIFSDEFLNEFKDLRVRIGLDSIDTEIIDNQIIFDKFAYCNREKIFEYSMNEKESTYRYYPLELNIRDDEYFYIRHYILSDEEIRIGLGDFKRRSGERNKLIEYEIIDEELVSGRCSNWINKHRLEREKNKEK
jgi:hypothetical protein